MRIRPGALPSTHLSLLALLPLRLPVLAHLGLVDNALDYLCSPSLLWVCRVFYLHTSLSFLWLSPHLYSLTHYLNKREVDTKMPAGGAYCIGVVARKVVCRACGTTGLPVCFRDLCSYRASCYFLYQLCSPVSSSSWCIGTLMRTSNQWPQLSEWPLMGHEFVNVQVLLSPQPPT